MNQFSKSEALSAIHIIQTARVNAVGYCKHTGDIEAATMAALRTAVHFAESGIPDDIVESLTYPEPR